MLVTSKDLFFVILSFALLWLAVFTCWALYYVIMMLRDASRLIKSVRQKVETVDEILGIVRDKVEEGSGHLAMIADTAIRFAGYFIDKKMSASSKRSKKE